MTDSKRVIVHHSSRRGGAAAVHLGGVADGLRSLGFEVVTIGPRFADPSSNPLGTKLPPLISALLRLGYNLVALPRLMFSVIERRPAFIWERHAPFAVAGVIVSSLTRVPLLLEVDSLFAQDEPDSFGGGLLPIAKRLEAFVLTRATIPCPVSRYLADEIATQFKRSDVLVVRNASRTMPIDLRADSRARFHFDGIVVGILQDFGKFPGHQEVMRDYAEYVEKILATGATVAVAGDGPSLPEFRRLLSVRARTAVRMLGRLAVKDVDAFVVACDAGLVVHHSPWTSPLKAFEMLAGGCVVFGPDHPALAELASETAAVMVTPNPAGSSAVVNLLAGRSKGNQLRLEALRFAEANTWTERARTIQRRVEELGSRPRKNDMRSAARRQTARALTALIPDHSRPGDAVLMFHSIGSGSEWSLDPEAFGRILDAIVSVADVIGPAELGNFRRGSRLTCCLTFDDGYEDFALHALPALKARRLPALLFVCTGLVDGDASVTSRLGAYGTLRPLTWRAVIDAAENQVAVGVHGVTHRIFSALQNAEVASELALGMERVTNMVGKRPVYFAFPNGKPGDFSRRDVDLAAAAGYSLVFSATWGRYRGGYLVPRIPVDTYDTPERVVEKLRGEWDGAVIVQRMRSISPRFPG